jgi:hypothetical protein
LQTRLSFLKTLYDHTSWIILFIFSDQLLKILGMIETTLEKYREEEEEGREKERVLCDLARMGDNGGVREGLKRAVGELRDWPERQENMTETALRYLVADIRGGQGEDCGVLYPRQGSNYV